MSVGGWLYPWCVKYADWGGLTPRGTSAPGDGTDAGGRAVRADDQAVGSRWRLRVIEKSAYQWHQLWRDGGVQALASRGPSGSRCRLSPGCLEKPGGHADRRAVPRLLERLRRHPVDAPARLQSSGPRPAGGRTRRTVRHRVAGGALGGGKRARAACGGYVCFEDEAGFTRRPPRRRTWVRRGVTPVVTIPGGCLPGPAVPFQQPPHRRHRQARPQTTADHRLDPGKRPSLIVEALRGRALAEFFLQRGEMGIGDGRGVSRARGAQASMPPSRQARRQRSTDRTLTRRSFAITAVFSPAANRSPA